MSFTLMERGYAKQWGVGVSRWQAAHGSGYPGSDTTVWYRVDPISIKNFSAVCWYVHP